MTILAAQVVSATASLALLGGAVATLPIPAGTLAAGAALMAGLGLAATAAWRLARGGQGAFAARPRAEAPNGLLEIPTPANDRAPGQSSRFVPADPFVRDLLLVDGVVEALALPQLFVPRAYAIPAMAARAAQAAGG